MRQASGEVVRVWEGSNLARHARAPRSAFVRLGVTLAAAAAVAGASLAASSTTPAPARSANGAAMLECARQQRWAAAESLANVEMARLEAERAPDSLAVADVLFVRAWGRIARTELADGIALQTASRCLDLRTRLGADPLDVARAHDLVGRVLDFTGRSDSALVHFRSVVDIRTAEVGPSDTLVANAWYRLGMVHRNLFQMPAALEDFGHALDIRERTHGPEHPIVSDILSEIGYCLSASGELDSARVVLERALRGLARTVGPDAARNVWTLDYLSGVELFAGDAGRALDFSHEALRVALLHGARDSGTVIRMRRNLASALYIVRDYSGMRVILEGLLPWYESHYGPDGLRTTNMRLDLGTAYAQLGDSAAALPTLREVERVLAARPGPPDINLAWAICRQGQVLHHGGNDLAARAVCERAIRVEQSRPQPSSYTLASLHSAFLSVVYALGDVAALDSTARELVQLTEANDMMNTPNGPRARMWQALAADRTGRAEQAWTHALDAFRLAYDQTRWSLRSLPERAALGLSEDLRAPLEIALDLTREASDERLRQGWDCLVRSRGLVRAEMSHRRMPRELLTDPTAVAEHAAWQSAQRRYAQALVNSRGSAAQAARLEQLRSLAEDAERRYDVTLTARRSQPRPGEVGLDQALAKLLPGQALVSCVELTEPTGIPRVLAFVARGDRAEAQRIDLGPTDALSSALDPWRAGLAASPGPSAGPDTEAEHRCRQLGQTVRACTWDRIAPALRNVRDVFLVADGPLLDLPWQALPEGERKYLVESGPRIHLLNAEWELLTPSASPAPGSLLAVGDPDYEAAFSGGGESPPASPPMAISMRSAQDPCAAASDAPLARLPASRTEAEDVARAWESGKRAAAATLLVGEAATETALKLAAPGRAVLHLATHGVVARDTCATASGGMRGVGGVSPIAPPASRPAPSSKPRPRLQRDIGSSPWSARRVWLALAGANRAAEHVADENEGLLTAEEVVTLDLQGLDWVVLSACHSGTGEAWGSEGTLGMRRAFHLAGARTVIASDWAVEDAATRDWMGQLYAARARGATSGAAAVQAASRAVLDARRRGGKTTHPFYWAAFSATGD